MAGYIPDSEIIKLSSNRYLECFKKSSLVLQASIEQDCKEWNVFEKDPKISKTTLQTVAKSTDAMTSVTL